MVEIDIQTKLNFSRAILRFEGKSKAHQKGTIKSGLNKYTGIQLFNQKRNSTDRPGFNKSFRA